jgi:hypothetical protein
VLAELAVPVGCFPFLLLSSSHGPADVAVIGWVIGCMLVAAGQPLLAHGTLACAHGCEHVLEVETAVSLNLLTDSR